MHGFYRYAIRLLLSMSMDEARGALGFPPGYNPSPSEISKAHRSMVFKHHPDRGGSHEKMVEINIAKDVLEGKRHERYRPSPPKDSEEEKRKEAQRKRVAALSAIERAKKDVGKALDQCRVETDLLGGYRLNIRGFLVDDYSDAIDKMQDVLDDLADLGSPNKAHPDMKEAERLCQSLSNRAMRLSKKYLPLAKLHGELVADLLNLSGDLTQGKVAHLYAETHKYIGAFNEMFQESRKLVGLIRRSEILPLEWDDMYSKAHGVLGAFAHDWSKFSNSGLEGYKSALERAVADVGAAVEPLAPEEWKKAPRAELWRYSSDFEWAKDVVARSA